MSLGCADKKVIDAAHVHRGGAVEDVVEDFDLGARIWCRFVVDAVWIGQVVGSEDIDGSWVVRGCVDVDTVRDEGMGEIGQGQAGRCEGLGVNDHD